MIVIVIVTVILILILICEAQAKANDIFGLAHFQASLGKLSHKRRSLCLFFHPQTPSNSTILRRVHHRPDNQGVQSRTSSVHSYLAKGDPLTSREQVTPFNPLGRPCSLSKFFRARPVLALNGDDNTHYSITDSISTLNPPSLLL